MARQAGILPIEGTIGNITFFKSGDGFMVRQKGGVSGDKIATAPAFERTRENMAEFGRAGKASKLLRSSVRSLIQKAADPKMIGRLQQSMMIVIHEDTVNPRGQRNVIDGEAALLKGFDFNSQAKLGATLYMPITTSYTRASGVLTASFEAFVASTMVAAPSGTTHFKLSLAGTAVDFENDSYEVQTAESAYYPWDNSTVPAFDLTIGLSPATTHPVFCVLLVEFVQQVNGTKYALKNGSFNAASIVEVDAD